ncbi:MAG: 4-(cytidine 5'-diphospho)-2-C-methyl-D-erythritol kinase [Rhizobiales bacterium]|nr:4-(cytidine 5'-diphospho)-2-C-methyl-D-erythritol kinase [Hyphomicrobiales bacterium]NRB13466.1 4-(cytidine 5'-diphospho)-2-C-methyl-D-erythritol kinase [Hyphomicrobiales bacterium]
MPTVPAIYKQLCPAKANLFLHIKGKRADGYHILESLVTFADFGDELTFEPGVANEPGAKDLSLDIDGQYATELAKFALGDNLIIRAAKAFEHRFELKVCGKFNLQKNLPLASGIGGGSANAAMAIKLLKQAYDQHGDVDEMLLALGADVPVCYGAENSLMTGIGERLEKWRNLPKLNAILVNPNEAVSTAKIFGRLNASAQLDDYEFVGKDAPTFKTAQDLVGFLQLQTNDMQAAAVAICPAIGNVLAELNAINDIMLSRMSGSGATCFGLFTNQSEAELAARKLANRHPNWWIQPTTFSG